MLLLETTIVPATLIPSEVMTILSDFASKVVPTAMIIVGLMVPIALSVFGINLAIKKLLPKLQDLIKRIG